MGTERRLLRPRFEEGSRAPESIVVQEGVRIMGCLALNASFEPLTMIPARRAIRLVYDPFFFDELSRLIKSRLSLSRGTVIRFIFS